MSSTKKELKTENPFEDFCSKPRSIPRINVGETYTGPPNGDAYVCTKYSVEGFYDELVVEMRFIPKEEVEEEEGEQNGIRKAQ